MQITELVLRNYRCFENFKLSIPKEGAILVGRNGAGKSSLLQAMAIVLDSTAVAISSATRQVDLKPTDVRHEEIREGRLLTTESQYPIEIQASLDVFNIPTKFDLIVHGEDEFGRSPSMAIENMRTQWQNSREGRERRATDDDWPLVAYYSPYRGATRDDGRPDLNSAVTTRPNRSRDGYGNALAGDGGVDNLVQSMAREELRSLQEGRDSALKIALQHAIRVGIYGQPEARYLVSESEVVLEFDRRSRVRLSELSDGQRSVLNIIADLTIRCHGLNPQMSDPSKGTSGIVLIDELDLHLHPGWQRHVYRSLKTAFPNVQFIAATHSPQILGEVPAELVKVITPNSAQPVDQSEGMSSDWILKHLMETTDRSDGTDRQLDQIREKISIGELRSAQQLLQEFRESYGTDPEVQRLVARIEKLMAIQR